MNRTSLLSISLLAGLYATASNAQEDITGPNLTAPVTVQVDALGVELLGIFLEHPLFDIHFLK